MAKRLTKQQREQREIEALRKRLTDIYSGSAGRYWDEDVEWPDTDILAKLHPAVRDIFTTENVDNFVFATHNLDEFESPSRLAKFLYQFGARAHK